MFYQNPCYWNMFYKCTLIEYCKTQNIRHALICLPSRKERLFRPVLNSSSYNIDYTFCMRMFIHHCFDLTHCQLGENKTRANKTHSTVYIHYIFLSNWKFLLLSYLSFKYSFDLPHWWTRNSNKICYFNWMKCNFSCENLTL